MKYTWSLAADDIYDSAQGDAQYMSFTLTRLSRTYDAYFGHAEGYGR